MQNNTQKKRKKPIKPVKRIIGWECYNPYVKSGEEICSLRVTYIIDNGDLIQDVQTKYTQDIGECNIQQRQTNIQQYAESKKYVQRRLEKMIYDTGATIYTAEKTAKRLLTENKIVMHR